MLDKLRGFPTSVKLGPGKMETLLVETTLSAFNVSTTLPQILPSLQSIDILIILLMLEMYGHVDYNSSDLNDSGMQ